MEAASARDGIELGAAEDAPPDQPTTPTPYPTPVRNVQLPSFADEGDTPRPGNRRKSDMSIGESTAGKSSASETPVPERTPVGGQSLWNLFSPAPTTEPAGTPRDSNMSFLSVFSFGGSPTPEKPPEKAATAETEMVPSPEDEMVDVDISEASPAPAPAPAAVPESAPAPKSCCTIA
mmetsp:Transcript_15099/g.46910  ORF Transcript_15099/g.46910 Transcript_15099/m.46910 type:complete len:177 (-) Transcript_15099:136-666(-)